MRPGNRRPHMRISKALNLFEEQSAIMNADATVRGQIGDLKRFCIYMRDPLITQVTSDHVVAYLRAHLDLGWKRDSLMSTSLALRKFFEFWKRRGYPVLDWQILPLIKKEGALQRVAATESLQKLLGVCGGSDIYSVRNNSMIRMLADTGMRNGEMCSMNVELLEKVQRNGNQYAAIIRTEKRKGVLGYRRVFWYQETHDALLKWLSFRTEFVKMFAVAEPEALYFSVRETHGKVGQRVSPNMVGVTLKKLSHEAGIPTVNPHSLRHLFGNTAAAAGLNNSNISDLMGHAKMESSFVYTHLNGAQLGNAHAGVYNGRHGSTVSGHKESLQGEEPHKKRSLL